MTSPQLDRPLRTEAEAKFDVALRNLDVAGKELRASPTKERRWRFQYLSLLLWQAYWDLYPERKIRNARP